MVCVVELYILKNYFQRGRYEAGKVDFATGVTVHLGQFDNGIGLVV